jgi:hypothetical protein
VVLRASETRSRLRAGIVHAERRPQRPALTPLRSPVLTDADRHGDEGAQDRCVLPNPFELVALGTAFFLQEWMLWRERFHAIEREEELERQRLLGPERPVIVEGGDARWYGDEIR